MSRRTRTIAISAAAGAFVVGVVVAVVIASGSGSTPVVTPSIPAVTALPTPSAQSGLAACRSALPPAGNGPAGMTFSGVCSFTAPSAVDCSAETDDSYYVLKRDALNGSTITYQLSIENLGGPDFGVYQLFQVNQGGIFYSWTATSPVTLDPGARSGTVDATLTPPGGSPATGTEHVSGRFVCS